MISYKLKYFLNPKKVISYMLKFVLGSLNLQLFYKTLKKKKNFSHTQLLSHTHILFNFTYFTYSIQNNNFPHTLLFFFFRKIFISVSSLFMPFFFFFLRKILISFTCFFLKFFFVFLMIFIYHFYIYIYKKI